MRTKFDRYPLISRFDSVPASECGPLPKGERVILDFDKVSKDSYSEAIVVESTSGWRVESDYRPTGNIIISGRDYKNRIRTMPVSADAINVDKKHKVS